MRHSEYRVLSKATPSPKTTENNVDWIDVSKGIGIILVVYGHVARGLMAAGLAPEDYWLRAVDGFIYSFHMPLFFFLSGMFFLSSRLKRGPTGLVTNKIDTVFYPYLVWSILQGSIEASLSGVTNGQTTWAEVLSLLWAPRAHFWFLYALFLIFIVSTAIYRRSFFNHVAIAVIALAALLSQSLYNAPTQIQFITNNFVYFALGVIMSKWAAGLASSRTIPISAGLITAATVQVAVYLELEPSALALPLFSFTLAVLGILSVLLFSVIVTRGSHELLLTLGVNSMGIYLMHVIAGSGARVILERLFKIEDVAVHLIVGCAAGIIAPLAALKLSKTLRISWPFVPPKKISATNLFSSRPDRQSTRSGRR